MIETEQKMYDGNADTAVMDKGNSNFCLPAINSHRQQFSSTKAFRNQVEDNQNLLCTQ